MSRLILSPTTDPSVSEEVVLGNLRESLHMFASLQSGETATVQVKLNDGSFVDYYLQGTLQQILWDHTGVWVVAPGTYRMSKSATAAPVGITLSTPQEP